MNKTTATAKEAFELAFKGMGGIKAFTEWAKENQDAFYHLYAKLLPQDVKTSITGAAIVHTIGIGGEASMEKLTGG